jgi:hypothetical protein
VASAAPTELKNSSFDFVLKGRGFKPRRKSHKINSALAAEVPPQIAMPLFQQTVPPPEFALAMKLFSGAYLTPSPASMLSSIHRRASLIPVTSPHSHFGRRMARFSVPSPVFRKEHFSKI